MRAKTTVEQCIRTIVVSIISLEAVRSPVRVSVLVLCWQAGGHDRFLHVCGKVLAFSGEKKGARYLVHGVTSTVTVPEKAASVTGTTLRFTGLVPVDSRR